MLAADKLQLQSAVRQQATALKEKEFNLHHSNMSEFQKSKQKEEKPEWMDCRLSFFFLVDTPSAKVSTFFLFLNGLPIFVTIL